MGVLATFAVIFSTSLAIDPFGISPFSDVAPGANEVRLSRNGNDALIKPFDLIREQPQILFLGSSRIKRSVDPGSLNGATKRRVYNGAADGYLLPFAVSMLDEAFRYAPSVQEVYIELFNYRLEAFYPLKFIRPAEPLYPIEAFGPGATPIYRITIQGLVPNLMRMTVGPSARIAEVQMLYDETALGAGLKFPAFTHLSGFYPAEDAPFVGDSIISWTKGRSLETPLDKDKVNDKLVPLLEAITAKAKQHGVRVTYFIAPFHSWVMYGYDFYHDWQNLEELKQRLARLRNVYDFMRFNEFTDEAPQQRMVYWRDTFHFTPKLGSLVARKLLGQTIPDLPRNFGVLLTPDNIEKELDAFRRERDAWIARNPAVVANYELAARQAAAKKPPRN